MKKSNLTILIVAIVALLVIGAYFLLKPSKNDISKDMKQLAGYSANECAIVSDADDQNLCWALKNSSEVFCNKIVGVDKQNECFKRVAEKTLKVSVCDNLKMDSLKYDCYSNVAVVGEDYTLCAKIGTGAIFYMNNCYKLVAVKLKDRTICNNIPSSFYKNQCEDSVLSST